MRMSIHMSVHQHRRGHVERVEPENEASKTQMRRRRRVLAARKARAQLACGAVLLRRHRPGDGDLYVSTKKKMRRVGREHFLLWFDESGKSQVRVVFFFRGVCRLLPPPGRDS